MRRASSSRLRNSPISPLDPPQVWTPQRDVADLLHLLAIAPNKRTEAECMRIVVWLRRNPATAPLFAPVPEVLFVEIARQAVLTTVDAEVDDVLVRQGQLLDYLHVVLRGEGVCYRRDPTSGGSYTWSAEEVALDDRGRLPVRCQHRWVAAW